MKYFLILIFVIIIFTSNFAYGKYSYSKFVARYPADLTSGEEVEVLVKVKGDVDAEEEHNRAREIRYFQSPVLKFIHFAGAKQVKSDTMENQFTAIMTTSLAQVVANRNDVISVTVLDDLTEVNGANCAILRPKTDLSHCDMYGWKLRSLDLSFANLTGADLKAVEMENVNLHGAILTDANLKHAYLYRVNLSNVDFTSAKLIETKIEESSMENSTLKDALLLHTEIEDSNISNSNFIGAIISNVKLKSVNLEGNQIDNSTIIEGMMRID